MSRSVDHGPECHRVGHLSVEPQILVRREKPRKLRTKDADDVSQQGNQNESPVKCEDQAGTPRNPDRKFEQVQRR
jgi:hypothetical protein